MKRTTGKKKLQLTSETLRTLKTVELGGVAGGGDPTFSTAETWFLTACQPCKPPGGGGGGHNLE